jgi:beta-fructofuranosidase
MRASVGGVILLYRSVDLIHWEYLHPLLGGDAKLFESVWTGVIWECPNLLTFGDQRVLILSIQGAQDELLYPLYVTGTFREEQFSPHTQGVLVYGGYFYAPQVVRDDQGRYIMWGWLREGRSQSLLTEAGWAGVMSLPIIIAPRSGGGLSLTPAPELTTLRQTHWHYEGITLSNARNFLHEESQDARLEILAEFELSQDCEFGLQVHGSPDGQEQTHLVYQAQSQQLSIEREQSSRNPEADHQNCSVVMEGDSGEVFQLHLFLDHSVLEVFVNGRYYLASRIYPQCPDRSGLTLFARRGTLKIRSLDIWDVASIWSL